MLSLSQAIVLGLVQGISELFPISSLGHSVLLPGLLGWHLDQNADEFLTFLVATHFATALVLFCLYFKDWIRIIGGIFRSIAEREIIRPEARLGWLIVIATIPAGIVGILFQTQLENLFISPVSAAFFLILNGFLLFGAERLRKRRPSDSEAASLDARVVDERLANRLSPWQVTKIGVLQVISLIPGFSRTGSTLSGGLWSGLSHEDALRFSFLLAAPIIGAAALLKLPPLLISSNIATLEVTFSGAVAAALAAYFSAKFLVEYFKTKTLIPFAIYCIAIGAVSLLILR